MEQTHKRLWSLILALVMILSLIPAIAPAAEAAELPAKGTLARTVLDNCQYSLDLGQWYTAVDQVNKKYGAGHLQGFCCDDKGEYFYASFTNLLVKVDMKTGEIVGTVTGLAAGSISSGAHIGDICYYKGRIYGSLEYKASERWYICVFDGAAITGDMHYTDPGVMYGLYVPQVGDDFKEELTAGEHVNSVSSMGHRYGTGGIDGITFGTLPGGGYDTDGDGDVDVSTGDERFMIVTYGPYGNAKRYDNENFVFLVYDFDNITDKNLIPFTENLLTMDYTEEQKLFYEHKLFCYNGNQQYGVQQLEYDEDTGDLLLECYGRPSGSEFPGYSRYVIDGSVPLYMDTVEVGQSVTGDASGFVTKEAALATAACYTDYEDGDGDGNKTEQETGWHMTLKCICGNGKTLDDHEEVVYGQTGYACKICGSSAQFSTGLRSLGNDYFYGASSSSGSDSGGAYEWGEANLYKLDRTTYTYTKVTEPARLLMSYTMDASDTYEKDGVVYIKDASGNGYDAVVQGTYAATGVSGNAATALGFRGDEYGSVVDRVYVSDKGMEYINEKVSDTFSYSFWMYNEKEMDRFTPIVGMYRDSEYATGLYVSVVELRYKVALAVVGHKYNDPTNDTLYNGEVYDRDPGDACTYIGGNTGGRPSYGNMAVFNDWQHVVVVRSGSTVTVYVDGVKVSTSTNAGSSDLDNLSAFEIGGYVNRNWVDSNVRTRFTGLIDDVRIYAGGLTDDEVTALYNAGNGAADSSSTGTGAVSADADPTFGTYSGDTLDEQEEPIVYLSMDGIDEGIVADKSGNGIDAVATDYVKPTTNADAQADRALSFAGMSNTKQTALTMDDEDTAWLSAQLNATGKMTISFWMNADFENSHRMSILGVYGKDGKPIGTFETRGVLGQDLRMDGRFAIAFTSAKPYSGSGAIDEKTYEQIAVTNTTTQYTVNGNSKHYGDKVIHQWYHVVGELDSTTNKMSLYINGELVQTVDIADGSLAEIGYFMVGQPATRYYEYENASNATENTGSSNGRANGWAMRDGYVGTIDEIKIYNTILSQKAVAELYAEGTMFVDTLVSVTAPEAITGVTEGTKLNAIALPSEVTIETAEKTVTSAEVEWDLSHIDYDPNSIEEQTFTIPGVAKLSEYVGNPNQVDLSVEITVTVNGAKAESLKVTKQPVTNYCANQTLDLYGMEVEVTYTNGTTTMIEDYTVSIEHGTILTDADNGKTITVTYNGITAQTNALTVGHEWSEWTVETEATCTSIGFEKRTCADCGKTEIKVIQAPGHDHEAEKTAPTCTAPGYTVYTCECGDSYVAEIVEPTGHSYTDTVTAPTHDTMGYTTHSCACGHSYVDTYVAATGHDYASKETKAPTCTEEGELTFTCECGESYTQAIPMADHEYTAEKVEPTCTSTGYTIYTCECGDSYMADPVAALGHDYAETVVKATCEGFGYTEYACRECGHTYVGEITDSLGHKWGEGEITTPAAEDADGVMTYTCEHDSKHTKTEVLKSTNCPSEDYTDVVKTEWYHEAVDYMVENEYMNGLEKNLFGVNGTLSRAQLVTILYRVEGEPSVEGLENPFEDVPADTWYTDAVVWAAANGVVKGTSDTTFAPTKAITREQIVTILYRYSEAEAAEADLSKFADAAGVSDYAAEAMAWAVDSGIMTGSQVGDKLYLNPQNNATRVQCAAIVQRFLKL